MFDCFFRCCKSYHYNYADDDDYCYYCCYFSSFYYCCYYSYDYCYDYETATATITKMVTLLTGVLREPKSSLRRKLCIFLKYGIPASINQQMRVPVNSPEELKSHRLSRISGSIPKP